MRRRTYRGFCLGLLCLGLLVQGLIRPPAQVVADPTRPAVHSSGNEDDFILDIGQARGHLNRLRVDERSEQVADWAVLATLLQRRVEQKALREIAHDRPPYRLPTLEEIEPFDYGRGRRVMLPDGGAWLFYEDGDSQRDATLARQADRVRMEAGERPRYFVVFRYQLDAAQGKVRVRREAELQGTALFSPRYGYIEARVTSAGELGAWLAQVDDVSHVELAGNAVVLGGRRFASARTAGVTLEDIAALYQAHTHLKEHHEKLAERARERTKPLVDAFNELVNSYNAHSYTLRQGSLSGLIGADDQQLQRAVHEALGHRALQSAMLGAPGDDLEVVARLVGASVPDNLSLAEKIEWLRRRVDQRVEELGQEFARELVENGDLPPQEPGFSLDPRWDLAGLRADLILLLQQPQVLVQRLRAQAARLVGAVYDEASTPVLVSALRMLPEDLGRDAGLLRPTIEQQRKLRDIVAALGRPGGTQAESEALVPLLELEQELSRQAAESELSVFLAALDQGKDPRFQLSGSTPFAARRQAVALRAILKVLTAEHRAQCARYDGPLQGTRVGMNLFYTDLLAKLWAGVDYYRSVPSAQVPGFLTMPAVSSGIERNYLAESRKYNSTRLWFGPSPDALKTRGEELNFAPISTRIYAAGSNPLQPGKEVQPAEGVRRVLGWWDRHFAQVAEYEPQYHVQNQIMKWSVISGKLAASGVLADLAGVAVDRSQRFDRWYRSAPDLRFQRDVRILPPERWLGGTECMEILQSYPFAARDGLHSMSGGVSLGGKETLEGQAIASEMPLSSRRSSTNYATSTPARIENWRKTAFELSAERPEVVQVLPHADVRMRNAGSEILQRSPIEAAIKTYEGAGQYSLRSSAGSLMEATFLKMDGGLQLKLSLGSEGADQALMAQLAEDGPGLITAARDAALAGPGRYLIESQGRPAVLLDPSADGAGGGSGSPPHSPRLLSFADPEGPQPGAFSVTGGQYVVQKVLLGNEAAAQVLREQRYQVLQADGPVGQPGLLVAHFSKHAPSDGVHATIDLPGIGVITALVYDNRIYLDRPATTDARVQQAFNDLSTNGLLTALDVKRIVTRARRAHGEPIAYRQATQRSAQELAAISVEHGGAGGLIEALQQAQDQGVLAEAIEQANQAVESARRRMTRRLHGNAGEDQNTVGAQGGVSGPGPNLGDAHAAGYASWKPADFLLQLGLRLEQEQRAEARRTHAQESEDSGSARRKDGASGGGGGSQASGWTSANDGQQGNQIGLAAADGAAGCADLNHDGYVDAQEVVLCQRCRDAGGDLNHDGKIDDEEVTRCGCSDLNGDGAVDAYERGLCGLCLKTHGDLNGDGRLDSGEVVSCSPVP